MSGRRAGTYTDKTAKLIRQCAMKTEHLLCDANSQQKDSAEWPSSQTSEGQRAMVLEKKTGVIFCYNREKTLLTLLNYTAYFQQQINE